MAIIWISSSWPYWYRSVRLWDCHGTYRFDLLFRSGCTKCSYHKFFCRFVAATVLSINHVNSLKLESECAAPGEKPQFLGVREQRVTHICIFLMIGCSVLLTPLLSHIPMPVLFGVFLYMGVASLKGLQFFDRILIMFMPVKYQPDFMFLRQVNVHIVCFVRESGLLKSFVFPHRFQSNAFTYSHWFSSPVWWYSG